MTRIALLVVLAGIATGSAGQGDQPLTPIAPATQPTQPGAEAAKPPKRAAIYDERADAQQQIAAALERAKKENTRVLLQWGFNSCHWCHLMHSTFKSDPAIRKKLSYEYEVVLVDCGSANEQNREMAGQYGAEVAKQGFPYLTVLDAEGRVLANQETASLELKDEKGESVLGDRAGHDPAKLLAFLKAHEATPLDAEAVLASARTAAAAAGKSVFLHFGAPWCTWCHKLDAWLERPEVAALFAKDFVEVKIDQDRMTGAKAVYERYKKEPAGIPWFAILDGASGAVIATSDAPDGNIGFPAAESEIAHFVKMLESARKNLTDEEISVLKSSLQAGK